MTVNETGSVEQSELRKQAERECLMKIDVQMSPNSDELYCSPFWDGWGCWNFTLAGTRTFISCPSYIPGFDPRLSAYRDCNPDGTWWKNPITNNAWANYTTCINVMELEKSTRLVNIYIVGYSVSMVMLVASIAIFVIFKRQLKCDRVTLHEHLFSSYILNGIVWILYYVLTALNASVISSNPVWCQMLHVVTQYFVMCNFFWMFCEGCYLHTIIVLAFTNSKKLLLTCYVTGWGFPVAMTTIYAVARWNSENPEEWEQCWIKESTLQWIVSGPIVVTVIMNLIFLCNIVRVLVTKLRAVNSPEAVQTKKAVKATLILIPLLGLQYILFPMRPAQGTVAEDVYLTVVALVTSLQGVFVAVLFCFMNGEVVGALKHRWHQQNSIIRNSSEPHRSMTHSDPLSRDSNPRKGFSISSNARSIVQANGAFSMTLGNGSSFCGNSGDLQQLNDVTEFNDRQVSPVTSTITKQFHESSDEVSVNDNEISR